MTLSESMGRSALNAAGLTAELVRPGGLWQRVRVAAETGSTNADLLAAAAAGAGEGEVLAAETQTAGKGRLGRSWASAPGASLTFSVLLRPAAVAPVLLGWLPLLAGVAVATAAWQVAGVAAQLKWPNDVLADGGKLAGILAEARAGAVVLGIGVNVSQQRAELPVPTATSLVLARAGREREAEPAGAAMPGRGPLLVAILTEMASWYQAWTGAGGDPDACGLRAEYAGLCATVGRPVRVMLPGQQTLTGEAAGVDRFGRLLVRGPAGLTGVSAGDVVHVR